MTLDHLTMSLYYVANAPNFWGLMGILVSIAMLIGAIVYDGELKQLTKGIITLGSYMIILLWMTINRVFEQIESGIVEDYQRAWAGIVTMVITTVTFIMGLGLGCLIFKLKGFKK